MKIIEPFISDFENLAVVLLAHQHNHKMYVTSTYCNHCSIVVEKDFTFHALMLLESKNQQHTICEVSEVLEKKCHTQLASTQQEFISRNLFTYSFVVEIFTRKNLRNDGITSIAYPSSSHPLSG